MQKIREMVEGNTIIGEPITTVDNITLIPVTKVNFGVAGGGNDGSKKSSQGSAFGGGVGTGVMISPVAFVVIKDGNVRLLHVAPSATSTVERIIDTVPEMMDKITVAMNKGKEEKEQSE